MITSTHLKIPCHSEGAVFATDTLRALGAREMGESRNLILEILRSAQGDILR
jgi:hypothetical protein